MKTNLVVLFVVIVSVAACSVAWADRAYVTDSFEVTLRTGPSSGNKIIAMPRSGQPLEVLEEEGDWSHVNLLKGGEPVQEGWILSRYLVRRVPWELQAKSLGEENASLKEKLGLLEDQMGELQRRNKELTIKLEGSEDSLRKMTSQYDTLKKGSASYLELKRDHEAATAALETAEEKVRKLSEENEILQSSQRNKWFATGALVLLCGLMIGVVVGSRQKKRRSSLYS
jgi:SH3 domain protein